MDTPPAPVRHILSVCRTCHRYAARSPGESTPGERLAHRLEALIAGTALAERLTLRRVECLSGCRHPCNVSLSAFGKTRLRFNNVGPEQAEPLVVLARRYLDSAGGEVRGEAGPLGLEARIASAVPPPSQSN